MKKVMLFALCMVLAATNVCLAKDKKVKPENLPAPVQQFVKNYFPSAKIVEVTQEADDLDFNLTLSNGTKLEFGKDNQWSEIANKKANIPSKLIPSQIINYVKQKYPGTAITCIERSSLGYDISLSNNKQFQLNKQFQPAKFKDVD
jgi:hypothetical protein